VTNKKKKERVETEDGCVEHSGRFGFFRLRIQTGFSEFTIFQINRLFGSETVHLIVEPG
jgi:hypothetical protein